VARRVVAHQSVLQVVHFGELSDLGKVSAHEREMVALVHVADAPDPFHRALVADVATERVARVRGVGDHASVTDDVHGRANQARLRVVRMHREVLRHPSRAPDLAGAFLNSGVVQWAQPDHTGVSALLSGGSRPGSHGLSPGP
jgi:hypothetical protein